MNVSRRRSGNFSPRSMEERSEKTSGHDYYLLLFPRFSRNEKARNRAQETFLSFFSPLPYLTDVRTRLNEAPQQFNQTLNRCLTIPTVAIPILFFPGCTSANFQSARDAFETTLLAGGIFFLIAYIVIPGILRRSGQKLHDSYRITCI